jgi:hypothetical protein
VKNEEEDIEEFEHLKRLRLFHIGAAAETHRAVPLEARRQPQQHLTEAEGPWPTLQQPTALPVLLCAWDVGTYWL